MALSGRAAAIALAGVLVVLIFRSPLTVVAIDAALLALIVADVLLAAPPAALTLRRDGDAKVRLGEPATVTTTITNSGRRPLAATIRDGWPPSAGATPAQLRLRIPPGGQGRLAVTLRPQRPGDCTAATLTIRSSGPLGLAARQVSLALPWTVRALPPFPSRRHLPGKLAVLHELDGQHRAVRPGQGSEFDSLREYVPGDDVRSVDWRSTARRRDVMVRTWRPERDRRIIVVLDTGRTSAGRAGRYPRLDAAMDAAQLLTALACKAGDRVGLIAADYRVRARLLGPARTTALAEVSDALAGLSPELAEADWRLIAATVLAAERRRCLVVVLTDLNPSVELVPALRPLAARHELLIGAVADPRLAALAAGRGDAASVYGAAAAARAAAERAALAAQLTRLGATVTEAPPERIAPALADAYLALKARGRL